jgi:hypothetical protein
MSLTLDRALYQKSHLYFLAFFACMVAAFWFTYFTRFLHLDTWRQHAHGIALILWCLMLVGQPLLIRAKQFAWHRRVGRGSYVLVPILFITTLDLLKYRLSAAPRLETGHFAFAALVINSLVAFGILYGLAIWFRKRPVIHARFMVATAFPMFTPITDRIISIYLPSLVPYLPLIEGTPNVPLVGFLMANAMLVGLSIWDWVSHKRWNVFPFALVVLLAYHWSFLYGYQFAAWQRFCTWFVAL